MIEVFESFAGRQLGEGKLTVTRQTTGSPAYVNGYPVAVSATTTIPIIAQVSPTGGRDLRILADQGIVAETRSLLCATELVTRTKTTEPDRITGVDLDTADGSVWVVVRSEMFTAPDGDRFWHAIVARDATQ